MTNKKKYSEEDRIRCWRDAYTLHRDLPNPEKLVKAFEAADRYDATFGVYRVDLMVWGKEASDRIQALEAQIAAQPEFPTDDEVAGSIYTAISETGLGEILTGKQAQKLIDAILDELFE